MLAFFKDLTRLFLNQRDLSWLFIEKHPVGKESVKKVVGLELAKETGLDQ